jgi:hypothetical protein
MPQTDVAKLDFCYEDGCSFSDKLHLAAKLERVELEKSHAVAISYTWGEFDRRDVDIGHFSQRSNAVAFSSIGKRLFGKPPIFH